MIDLRYIHHTLNFPFSIIVYNILEEYTPAPLFYLEKVVIVHYTFELSNDIIFNSGLSKYYDCCSIVNLPLR